MRLALMILTCLAIFSLTVGYLALMDYFDPVGTKVIFAANMGLLFFCIGLNWVFFLDLRQTRLNLEKSNSYHAVSGLMNRNEILKTLSTQMKAARRHRFPFSVLLIGMDEFGEINNRMGHRGGDIILKHVAERIDAATRDEDIVGHYEGDVFIVGACHSDADGAKKLADRILQTVTKHSYKTRGVTTEVMATVAVASVPPEDYDPEMLLYKVEDRLKMGKSQGGGIVQDSD